MTALFLLAAWISLFDGRTAQGWLEITGAPFPITSWTIRDGCLKTVPNPNGNQDIRTASRFRNFEFVFEWKLAPHGNSGVKYLIQKTDRWRRRGETGFQARARGLEYQLSDDGHGKEAFDPTRAAAALYSALAPTARATRPAGEWNEGRILVNGNHVEHWLNGVRVLRFELDRPKVVELRRHIGGAQAAESPISLQNHNSEAWFRNLRIRLLQ